MHGRGAECLLLRAGLLGDCCCRLRLGAQLRGGAARRGSPEAAQTVAGNKGDPYRLLTTQAAASQPSPLNVSMLTEHDLTRRATHTPPLSSILAVLLLAGY